MPEGLDALAATGDLAAFATANGWTYSAKGSVPASGASLSERASAGNVLDSIVADGWQVGHIVGGTGHAEGTEQFLGRTVHARHSYSTPVASVNIGFLAIVLPRHLPQIVLDATSNDKARGSSLQRKPWSFQRVAIGGEFAKRFTLYAPKGYELDALYVLSPNLLALLIDEAGDLDVEIRDNLLFVYRPGNFDFRDPAVWERFERIRDTLGRLTWSQSDGYADVTGIAGAVNPRGRRLRMTPSAGARIGLIAGGGGLLLAIGVVGFMLLRLASALLGS